LQTANNLIYGVTALAALILPADQYVPVPAISSAVDSRRALTAEAEVPCGVDQIRATTADVIGVDMDVPEPKS